MMFPIDIKLPSLSLSTEVKLYIGRAKSTIQYNCCMLEHSVLEPSEDKYTGSSTSNKSDGHSQTAGCQ